MNTFEADMKKRVEAAIIQILDNYGATFLEHGFHSPKVREAIIEQNFIHEVKFGLHGMEVRFSDYLYNLVAGGCSKEIYKDFESRIQKLGWESEERNYATVFYSPIPLTA